MEHVQLDAITIGTWFEHNAKKLSISKRTTYKYRSMKEMATRLSENYEVLKDWMKMNVSREKTR